VASRVVLSSIELVSWLVNGLLCYMKQEEFLVKVNEYQFLKKNFCTESVELHRYYTFPFLPLSIIRKFANSVAHQITSLRFSVYYFIRAMCIGREPIIRRITDPQKTRLDYIRERRCQEDKQPARLHPLHTQNNRMPVRSFGLIVAATLREPP
jgi:hypothetical protein